MKLLRRYPAVAFTQVMLGMVAFFIAHQSIDLLLVTGVIAAMSWYITEGPRGRTLPRWTATVLMIAAVVNAVVDGLQDADLMGVVGRFSVWLTLIKLYERKSARDYAHVMALSVVTVLAGCLESVDFFFGLVLVPYVCVAMYALILYQIYAAHERARTERADTATDLHSPAPPVQPNVSRHTVREFRSLATCVLLGGAALSVAVFAIFPRGFGEAMGASAISTGRARSGFAPHVSLRDPVRISESRKIVFTVRVLDAAGQPVQYSEPLYLRGAVLNRFDRDKGRWDEMQRPSASRAMLCEPGVEEPLTASPLTAPLAAYTLEFNMMAMATPRLFSIYAPIAVTCDEERSLRFNRATLTITDSGSGGLSNYTVRVVPAATGAMMSALSGNADRASSISFPNARIIEETERVLDAAEVRFRDRVRLYGEEYWRRCRSVAMALKSHLQSSGQYAYTTDLSDFVIGVNEDPVEAFLFTFRKGNCEHFASTLASMCRSVGVEARLVTGYIGLEYDTAEEQYIVRESNAHAWVEVRTGHRSWTTIDATPVGTFGTVNRAGRSWSDRLRWIIDSIEFQWNSRVVSFDSTSQAALAESISQRWLGNIDASLATVRGWLADVNRSFRLGPAGYIWMGIVGVAVVIAVMAIVRLLGRARAIRQLIHAEHLPTAEARRLRRQVGFYLDMLTVLADGGVGKPAWQPPRLFADDIADRRPELGPPVHRLVNRFYLARYGGAILNTAELNDSNDIVVDLADKLGVRPPKR